MALTDNQLLLLDNLIYTEYCNENGRTVGQIIEKMKEDLDDDISISALDEYLTDDDWRKIITAIENQPELLSYRVTYYVDDPETSMRAACFVDDVDNPTDVNVIFRGTASDAYEWHDNGQGAYLADTPAQIEALEYINNLPESYGNNITVSGHSKGGNKAQYVAILSDRVARCVSYDGQGFSLEFMEKYADLIEQNAYKITAYAASWDYVNCLFYSIADTIYLDAEIANDEDFLHYHRPDILVDEYGNLKPLTEQPDVMKLLNECTINFITTMDEPYRSMVIDSLAAAFEDGECLSASMTVKEGGFDLGYHFATYVQDKYGTLVAAGLIAFGGDVALDIILPDSTFWDLVAGFLGIVVASIFLIVSCAYVESEYEYVDAVVAVLIGAAFIMILDSIIDIVVASISLLGDGLSSFISGVKEFFSKLFSESSYSTSSFNPPSDYIRVDTDSLRECADRLTNLHNRVIALDSRIKALYKETGWTDLKEIIDDDDLLKYVDRINDCINWCKETADDFEQVDRIISYQF